MKPQQTMSEIDRAALSWFVARQGQTADPVAFAQWLAEDARHAEVYAKVEKLWESPAFANAAKHVRPRPGRNVASVAFALCLMLGTATGLKLSGTTFAWPADYSASVGEIAALTLDDGSRLMLDSGAAVDVDINADQREIRLLRGRLFLTVAEDSRPLRVLSGDAVIRDIGTAFSVTRSHDGEHVAVADGLVEIRARNGHHTQVLNAGDGGSLVRGALSPVRRINSPESFAWTAGHLYFSQQPVSNIVEELRRYHRGWIVITNEKAAALPISGGLSVTDPVAAMEELARLSGTRLSRVTDRILILR